ncbi:hypothetical protein BDAP_000564 [Binucleata daphniae]
MPEEKKTKERENPSLPENFYNHLNSIVGKISDNTKVSEFLIGKHKNDEQKIKIILFQVDKTFYITIRHAINYIEYHIDRGGYIVFEGYKEWMYKRLPEYTMSDIDQEIECEDINVTKLEYLTVDLFEKALKKSTKKREGATANQQDDFHISCVNENDIAKQKQKIKKSDEDCDLIMSEIKTSDDIELEATSNFKSKKQKLFPVSEIHTQKVQENNGKADGFQPFSRDWTNEMVDSIICTMYENKESKKGKPATQINYQIHPPQYEHEFLEMQSQMVKNERINATRPFVCHFKSCNRAFKRFEHLKRHYRIHTGERPFKCKFPGCHKAFARSDNLNQHLRVHNTGPHPTNSNRHLRYLENNE